MCYNPYAERDPVTTATQPKRLTTWDAGKQADYRQQHAQDCFMIHWLLDASPSMIPHADALMRSYNLYLRFLQQTASPMTMTETSFFSGSLTRGEPYPLRLTPPLIPARYQPAKGNGTALYNAVGELVVTNIPLAQHILVLFTDGEDCALDPLWTAAKVKEVLTTLQEVDGWLAVFLGAFPEALNEATAMGFAPGNSLVFSTDHIPEAFKTLQDATQQYLLLKTPKERKRLAVGGIFKKD